MSVGVYANAATIVAALSCGSGSCRCALAARKGAGLVHCLAHDDPGPSLNVGEKNGRLLVRCHAGCAQDAVVASLRERKLWPSASNGHATPVQRAAPRRVRRYEIRDAVGESIATHVREGDGPGKRIWWERGGRNGLGGVAVKDLPLYGTHELGALEPGTTVVVVEGEPARDALAGRGIPVVGTVCGAEVTPAPAVLEALRVFDVVLWPDADDAGRAHMQKITASLRELGVEPRSIVWPDAPPKGDAANFAGSDDELHALIAAATGEATARTAPEFATTDLGNAERLVAGHGEDLRYCAVMREWFAWDGRRWRADDTGEVERRAKDTARAIYGEAESANDAARRSALAAHAIKSEAATKISAMIALAQSEAKISLRVSELDTDPWALNVANGTLDLRTGELRPHRRDDLITMITNVEYDPATECPVFLAFLERVLGGDAALVVFMRRAIGYMLTGTTLEQKLLLLYGTGANGKSTLLELLRALLADYAKAADFNTFLANRDSIRNDIVRLRGARLVTATEMEAGRALAEVAVKQMTGGDTVTARKLYAEFVEFRPTFKLVLAANHKPTIRGTDHAIWRRILMVPFTVTIPAAEQDPQLGEKLRAELPGILAWAIRGCLEWQAQGLDAPVAVRAATESYREEMDALGDFLEDRCVVESGASVSSRAIYTAYAEWAAAAGEKPMARNALGMRLAERGFERSRRASRATRERLWKGIRLTETQALGITEADGQP